MTLVYPGTVHSSFALFCSMFSTIERSRVDREVRAHSFFERRGPGANVHGGSQPFPASPHLGRSSLSANSLRSSEIHGVSLSLSRQRLAIHWCVAQLETRNVDQTLLLNNKHSENRVSWYTGCIQFRSLKQSSRKKNMGTLPQHKNTHQNSEPSGALGEIRVFVDPMGLPVLRAAS